MNNKKQTTLLLLFLALFCASTVFVSCEDDDDDEVVLESFGPSPVARGAVLNFIGRNLSKVSSVTFANGTEVTSLTMTDKGFSLTVPQEAVSGKLTLTYGGNKIETLTMLGITDGIKVSSISPNPARPGQEVTITGEYFKSKNMGDSKSIIFANGQAVSLDDVEYTDTEIKVKVPAAAQSGDVIFTDGINSFNFSGFEIPVPTFTSFSKSADVFPGKDEITINGTDLDLVTSITFENGVEVKDFKADAKTLKFTYPADAKGAITMNVASGLTVEAGSVALVGPKIDYFGYNGTDETIFDPAVVYKLGSQITFTGENLKLVKSISFGGGTTTEFTVSDDGKSLTTTIPSTATCQNTDQTTGHLIMDEAHSWGRLYPGWQSGFVITAKSTTDDDLFVGYAYAEWGSGFWGNMGLTDEKDGFKAWPGTSEANDFITSITYDGKDVTEEYKTTGQVLVPLSAINSCPMKITLTNGASKEVDCSNDDLRATVNFPIVATFPKDETAGHLVEISGWAFTNDTKFEFVRDGASTEVTEQGFNSATSYYIKLPQSLNGKYDLKASNSNGSSIFKGIEVAGSMAVLHEGDHPLNWEKTLGGWDLTGVSKLQITFKGTYSGWLGIMFQNKAGNNIWAGQKDFGPADGEFTVEITGSDIPSGTDWYICGGTSGSASVTKVVAIF